MPHFPSPEINDFFDNRLIISMIIMQPPHLPSLRNILIQISSSPPVIFDPLQDPQLEIEELNNNKFIVNWVIQRPLRKTEVTLSIQSKIISEEHSLIINPEINT
ncbi:MAG: hypothetical protein JSU57_03055 [Candidatus Heimdallarchaeota archaeon]|nr:MAG: hypothetical protein JSU57_03055 [Candidatus Heimdallarchaeota archaeon]